MEPTQTWAKDNDHELVHLSIHDTESRAKASVRAWRGKRGHSTKVFQRVLSVGGAQALVYVATAHRKIVGGGWAESDK